MYELLIELEETFAVKFTEDEAATIITVDDLYQFVLKNTPLVQPDGTCLSQFVFFRLREAAQQLTESSRFRPSTLTDSLLPIAKRKTFWMRWQKVSQLSLPKLCRPDWISQALLALAIVFSCSAAFIAYRFTESTSFTFWMTLVVAVVTVSVLKFLTLPFATEPPKNCKTLRGLAECALRLNFRDIYQQKQTAQKSDIWIVIKGVLMEQLGVPAEKIVPSARLVQDLGFD